LTLYDFGFAAVIAGDHERALALVEEGLALARDLGEPAVLGEILCALGTLHWRAGDLDAAEPPLNQALELLAGSDLVYVLSWAHGIRAHVRIRKADFGGARDDFREANALFADSEDLSLVMRQLFGSATLALAVGDAARALRLVGAAEAAQASSRTLLMPVEYLVQGLEEATARVGKERAEELRAEGRLMPAGQALAYASEALSGPNRTL
jgi:tetratricopeptide (TPR) repeat protein